MLAKACLWLTPLLWFASLGVAGYGAFVALALILAAFVVAGVVWKREHGPVAASAAMFAAIWWVFWPAAIAAVAVAVGVLVPRKFWMVGAACTAAMVVFAAANPPIGPVHLAAWGGVVLVAHAIVVGATALVALRGRP